MPERARTDLWEPQGSNSLGPPGPLAPIVRGRHVSGRASSQPTQGAKKGSLQDCYHGAL